MRHLCVYHNLLDRSTGLPDQIETEGYKFKLLAVVRLFGRRLICILSSDLIGLLRGTVLLNKNPRTHDLATVITKGSNSRSS